MATYLLSHHHSDKECSVAFAAWHGFVSSLRGKRTMSSCLAGDHRLWWRITADTPDEALALLPPFVAERTEVIEVREVAIP